jgi:hypothetical protein
MLDFPSSPAAEQVFQPNAGDGPAYIFRDGVWRMTPSWIVCQHYTAFNSTFMNIKLPANFRAFKMVLLNWEGTSATDRNLNAYVSIDGGATWLTNAGGYQYQGLYVTDTPSAGRFGSDINGDTAFYITAGTTKANGNKGSIVEAEIDPGVAGGYGEMTWQVAYWQGTMVNNYGGGHVTGSARWTDLSFFMGGDNWTCAEAYLLGAK